MKRKFEWKHRTDKQQLTDAYRMCRESTLYFNYRDKIVEIRTPGEERPALIFGSLGETLCEVAHGQLTCSFEKMWNKIKALEAES